MRSLQISDHTWERFRRLVGLLDEDDVAMDRILGAAEEHLHCPKKATKGGPDPTQYNGIDSQGGLGLPKNSKGALNENAYERPILETLYQLGGSGQASQVLALIEQKLAPLFGPADYEIVSTGEPRLRNTPRWKRMHLVEAGLLKKGSPHGVWELTDLGFGKAKSFQIEPE